MPADRPRSRAPRRRRPATAPVDWKVVFERQMAASGLPEPVHEHPFEPDRGAAGYRWDWAWPMAAIKIAVEYDGGIYQARASHSSVAKMQRDRDKSNLATVLGWRSLRITQKNVQDGSALDCLRLLFRTVSPTTARLYREAWLPIYRASETRLTRRSCHRNVRNAPPAPLVLCPDNTRQAVRAAATPRRS